MIGFNGKYLSAAAIGDMRITAMSQGDKWLIAPWLLAATKAAILSAFGAEEGAGVIHATNAYLNGLATTDREKAQALAGFINEDPMMVCSLGLSVEGVTMPIRYNIDDGHSHVITNYVPKYNTIYKWSFSRDAAMSQWDGVQGSSSAFEATDQFTTHIENNNLYAWIVRKRNNCGAIVDGEVYDIEFSRSSLKKTRRSNGAVNTYSFYNSEAQAGTGVLRYGMCLGCPGDLKGKMYPLKAITNGVVECELVPFYDKTHGNGMFDLVNVVFYPNTGTGQFTIGYELPDGTPWTPLNEQ